ncbi:MAG: hypothetical protein ABIG11_07200, partial [bacterium]
MNITSEGVKIIVMGAVIAGMGWAASMWHRGLGISIAALGVFFTGFYPQVIGDPPRETELSAPAEA